MWLPERPGEDGPELLSVPGILAVDVGTAAPAMLSLLVARIPKLPIVGHCRGPVLYYG